jgi:hypothetical protein
MRFFVKNDYLSCFPDVPTISLSGLNMNRPGLATDLHLRQLSECSKLIKPICSLNDIMEHVTLPALAKT